MSREQLRNTGTEVNGMSKLSISSSLVAATAAAVAAVGWAVFADQLANDGWTSGGGTAWLGVFACVASVGVYVVVVALAAGRHLIAALGLLFVAASPTVFAYPLNIIVLLMAAGEAWRAVASRTHAMQS